MSSGNYVISLSMAPSLRLWRLWAAPKRVLWSVLRPLLERYAALQALSPSSESDFFYGIENWYFSTSELGQNKASDTIDVPQIWY